MDDALIRGAALEAPAQRLYARDVLLDAAHGDDQQPRGAGADLQDDQCGDAADVCVRLSALGYGPALDDLRSAVPLRDRQAQHPRRQRQARLQPRAGDLGGEGKAPRRPRRGGVGRGRLVPEPMTYFGLWSGRDIQKVSELLSSLNVRFEVSELNAAEDVLREWLAWDLASSRPNLGF